MCFGLHWLETLLIWAVVVGGIIAIVRLLLPRVFGPLGDWGAVLVAVLNIVLWIAVAVFAIIVVFGLLSCLVGVPFR
jgi:hypothetical protein